MNDLQSAMSAYIFLRLFTNVPWRMSPVERHVIRSSFQTQSDFIDPGELELRMMTSAEFQCSLWNHVHVSLLIIWRQFL